MLKFYLDTTAFLRLYQLPSLRDRRFYSAILLAETQECVSTSFRRTHDSLLKAVETKEYISLYSYELKRTIENDHQLKEYFFQALSNSSWANYGYLVAFEISEDVMEEMARLNRPFGIGVIKLSPYSDDTAVLFSARKNELDYYTIDKLCRMNPDFKSFITTVQRNFPIESTDHHRSFSSDVLV